MRLATFIAFVFTLLSSTGTLSAQQPEGDGESRDSLLSSGDAAEIGDYEVRVVDVIADATDVVLSENQYNEPPPTDSVFFIVRIEATYTGNETGQPWSDLTFSIVGDLNRGYSQSTNDCGVIPDEGYNAPELFEGGSIEFNTCWSVPADETSSLAMYVEQGFSRDAEPVWFSLELENDATPRP